LVAVTVILGILLVYTNLQERMINFIILLTYIKALFLSLHFAAFKIPITREHFNLSHKRMEAVIGVVFIEVYKDFSS